MNFMRKRSLQGNIAIGTCLLAFLLVTIAFSTSNWLVSDKGARSNHMGLWTHCFKWLADPNSLYDRRFLVGCQDELKSLNIPPYNRRAMVTTQVFFTIAFICSLIGFILSGVYFFFCGREHQRFKQMVLAAAGILLLGCVTGTLAIIIFGSQRDMYVWMPYNPTVSFGWSFYLACISVIVLLVSAVYYFLDARLHTATFRTQKSNVHQTVVDMK